MKNTSFLLQEVQHLAPPRSRFFYLLFGVLCFSFVLFSPLFVFAATSDLGISASNIRFSEETLYARDTVRLYATVRNYGETDITAKVIFYQGALLIGSSQTVSVLADGGSDDVYVDYDVPEGTFNIRAVIQGQNPDDENAANDEAITGLFTSIADDDRDGVENSIDNCVDEGNADQTDTDGDNRGDVCDDDRDGDGVKNGSDAYPDDASKSADPVDAGEPVVVAVPDPMPAEELVDAVEPLAIPTSQNPSDTSSSNPSNPSPSVPSSPSSVTANPGIFGFGTLSISPYAQFSYRRIDWRTYEFTALPSEGAGEITYAWDFGDGATSVQQSLVHAFPDAGQFVVTLAVIDEAGNTVSDAETFDISFFHLNNPWIQATLAVLFFVLLGLTWILVRLKESKEEREETV